MWWQVGLMTEGLVTCSTPPQRRPSRRRLPRIPREIAAGTVDCCLISSVMPLSVHNRSRALRNHPAGDLSEVSLW